MLFKPKNKRHGKIKQIKSITILLLLLLMYYTIYLRITSFRVVNKLTLLAGQQKELLVQSGLLLHLSDVF